MSYKDGGYYAKFEVRSNRTGELVDPTETFTLIPDCDPHAKIAVLAYADSVESDNATLAADLRERFAG